MYSCIVEHVTPPKSKTNMHCAIPCLWSPLSWSILSPLEWPHPASPRSARTTQPQRPAWDTWSDGNPLRWHLGPWSDPLPTFSGCERLLRQHLGMKNSRPMAKPCGEHRNIHICSCVYIHIYIYIYICQGFAKDLPYQLACILVQQSIDHVESLWNTWELWIKRMNYWNFMYIYTVYIFAQVTELFSRASGEHASCFSKMIVVQIDEPVHVAQNGSNPC